MVNGRNGNILREKPLFQRRPFETRVVGKYRLLALKGQWFIVHLSCKIHVWISNMQFFALAEEAADVSKWNSHRSETRNKWRKMSLLSNVIRCFMAGQGFGVKCISCRWYSIGYTLVCQSPIQYFITFGVNRSNRDDRWCVFNDTPEFIQQKASPSFWY